MISKRYISRVTYIEIVVEVVPEHVKLLIEGVTTSIK